MRHDFQLNSEYVKYPYTVIGGQVSILGKPEIYSSHIEKGIITGRPNIKGSQMFGGSVHDAAYLYITNLYDNCVIAGNSMLLDSTVRGHSMVYGQAVVKNSELWGHVQICGDAQLNGVVLSGWAFVHEGDWTRPPLNFLTKAGWAVTEGIKDKVTVTCTSNKISKWLSGAGRRFGRLAGLDEAAIDEVQGYVEQIRDYKSALLRSASQYEENQAGHLITQQFV